MPRILFNAAYLHLYVITDSVLLGARDIGEAVTAAVAGGATLVQYREKSLSRGEMYRTAQRLRHRTRELGIPLVINDHVDLAMAVAADAVHLGQDDLPLAAARKFAGDALWYGISTHSVSQAVAAARARPDYVAIGPVYGTRTKANPDPVVGLDGIREVRAALPDIPLVGIGGIGPLTAGDVRAAGADGVSVVGAVWHSSDITEACRALAR